MSKKMFHPREIVTLHFGQAGIQMGHAVWETLIAEHEIDASGKRFGDSALKSMDADMNDNAIQTFFHPSTSGQNVPRSLMVDTEPTVVDEVRTGFYRNLFHPDLLISGGEDASNNYARGYYTMGKQMIYQIIDKCRYTIESCDNFKGFISYSGSGGGTGSGLYSLILERLAMEFANKVCISTLALPGIAMNDAVVEPYNSIFRMSQTMSETDLNLLVGNESLYKICTSKLGIHRPTYSNINRILAPILSTITAPLRFACPMVGDLSEIVINLVPYPCINFPTISYAPFSSSARHDHENYDSVALTKDLFSEDNSMLNLDLKKYKIMSSMLAFRGRHCRSAIIEALNKMKKEELYTWVDWCPTGFKVTENYYPALHSYSPHPVKSIMMLCNHTGIVETLQDVNLKFFRLFKKRCFVHWFVGEGMEESEFEEAFYNVLLLRNNYNEVAQSSEKDDNGELKDLNFENALETHDSEINNRSLNSKRDELVSLTDTERPNTSIEKNFYSLSANESLSNEEEYEEGNNMLGGEQDTDVDEESGDNMEVNFYTNKVGANKNKSSLKSKDSKPSSMKQSQASYIPIEKKPDSHAGYYRPSNKSSKTKDKEEQSFKSTKEEQSFKSTKESQSKSMRDSKSKSVKTGSLKDYNRPAKLDTIMSENVLEESQSKVTEDSKKSKIDSPTNTSPLSINEPKTIAEKRDIRISNFHRKDSNKRLKSQNIKVEGDSRSLGHKPQSEKRNSIRRISEKEEKKSEISEKKEVSPKQENMEPKKSENEYELSAKTKEVLLANVTSMSPELRQRLLGLY